MNSTLDLLLSLEPPALPTKTVKHKRLSALTGGEVLFELRALPFSRVAELRETGGDDMAVHILLAGVASPDLKNPALCERYKAVTPAELVKTMLLPGEIEDLSRQVEQLSGFRQTTLEDIKKK